MALVFLFSCTSEFVSSDCLEWIKKDLSYTDKSKTVVVTMHSPIHTQNGGSQVDNATAFKNLFAGFTQVRFISGHSHKMYNIDCSGQKVLH